ncbi:ubiquitin-2 like Rad60 SUMO-like-domain-containing protein [Aspergillus aurantiobrunneus]
MRSYFNKPSWASRRDENGDSDFYRRAGQTYKDIVATNKSARERQSTSFQSSSHKRRRLSSSSSSDGKTHRTNGEQPIATETNSPPDNPPHLQDAPQHNTSRVKSLMTHQASLPSEPSTMNTKDFIPPGPQDTPESKLPDLRAHPLPDSISDGRADVNTAGFWMYTRAPAQTDTSRSDQKTVYDNTVVQILITSKIAKTKPLIIHRKMSQSLKGVRLAWCMHQNLAKELYQTVFLTWKGRRLFDVTTCRSLNIEIRSAFTKDLSPFDDCFSNTDDCRIRMEAVTDEMFAAEHQPSPSMVGLDPTPPSSTKSQDTEQQSQSEITLRCPGLDDFRIRVPLATNISQVVRAFREARSVSTELAVYLAFDGDRLDTLSCLADYDITDGDLVEVLLKEAT